MGSSDGGGSARPSRVVFCRVYYNRSLSHRQVADALGATQAEVDAWRREWDLPSRQWYGGFRPGVDEDDFIIPEGPARHDFVTGRVGQWRLWDRRRLPPATLRAVAVRQVGQELYWLLG